jgi:hypothetical protein
MPGGAVKIADLGVLKGSSLLLLSLLAASCAPRMAPPPVPEGKRVRDVCPPFHLKDEDGKIINPVTGENAGKPYSPRQTCGACHDYEKIAEGFHFQQGRGETPAPWLAERYAWVTSPGDYGGRW